MKHIVTILIFVFSICTAHAQSSSKADALFQKQKYEEAGEIYRLLAKRVPKSSLYNYRYARCLDELGDSEQAITYFVKAGERYALRNFYLGELYFETYNFDDAITAYEKYIKKLEDDDKRIEQLQEKIKKAEMALRYLKRVDDIMVVDSVVVPKKQFLKYYKLSQETGYLDQFSVKLTDSTSADVVAYTNQLRNRTYIPSNQNGQLDIFSQNKLMDKWEPKKSISANINTAANQNYPFFLSDGMTMYYASDDAEESLGGYDIFITRYNVATDSYLTPENIGMPFNSFANDYMMAIDEVNKLGWFATDRNQAPDMVAIYTFIPNEIKKIVKSEDEKFVAMIAQLKSYRKGNKPKYEHIKSSRNTIAKSVNSQVEEMNFFISDNIIYKNSSDFKSKEALSLFEAYKENMQELNDKQQLLNEKRAQYGQADSVKKQAIATEIIKLETSVMELELKTQTQVKEIRNKEIKYLSQKL